MFQALLAAISGRCPACQQGALKSGWITVNEKCPVCEVRFERWQGSWTIAAVMGYGSAAIFATILGFCLYRVGRLDGAENIIIPATMLFAALAYPICKNISIGLLFLNGFVFPDPPQLLPSPLSLAEDVPEGGGSEGDGSEDDAPTEQ